MTVDPAPPGREAVDATDRDPGTAGPPDGRRYRFGFVVEQVLGHITHGDNLRAHVPADPTVSAHWVFAPYATEGVATRIPVYRSNWTVRAGWRSRRMLRSVRRSTELDALFFHTQVPALLCHDHVRRTPTVVSLDATPQQYDELGEFYAHATGGDRIERLKQRATCASFAAAEHLVTWSAWAKQGLVDEYGVAADKVTVVPPGVTMSDWHRPAPRTLDPEAPTRILFVGGDLDRKGGGLLVEAFRRVRSLGCELHLVTRDEVAPEPGVFVHHGLTPNHPELRALYHDCDVFALPTFGDCLPMVLSEAGAAGLASVSTSVAAIPEVVLDGETGLVVPPGDVPALTDALRRLVERPQLRLDMGRRAIEHVARHYDTARNTAQLLSIMKRVADGEPVEVTS